MLLNAEDGATIHSLYGAAKLDPDHARMFPRPVPRVAKREGNTNALAPPSLRPRSQAITPPAPHAAPPLEPQAQRRLPRRLPPADKDNG